MATYQKVAHRFDEWCRTYGTSPETIDYKTFLRYIEALRERKLKPRTLKGHVSTLKAYFDHLVEEGHHMENIIKNINIKGTKKEVVRNILSPDELEDLYYSYRTDVGNPLSRKRNKVLLGLLVYQGLTTSELQRLKVDDVQLYKGKIDILGSKKTNGRLLELRPHQMMGMMEYLNEVRPRILELTHRGTERLFMSLGNSDRLQGSIEKLVRELKCTNQKFTNTKQLRASVIVRWLKVHDLRKTQYMAGHRYISSTERYLQDDIENLHEMVNNFHPIN